MKKTSIITALAIIALSTTQIMAQQFYNNIDEELQSTNTFVQDTINTQNKKIQEKKDRNPYLLYVDATLDLVELRDNEYLFLVRKNKVRRKIFNAINKLAESTFKVIEYDPEADIQEYIWCIDANLSEKKFQYFNKKKTLQELFDFAIQNIFIYYDENTPIAKLLNMRNELKDENPFRKQCRKFCKELSDWPNSPYGRAVLEGYQNNANAGK